MAKFELKPKAHDLRTAGKSLTEISRALSISKSTASLWCRELKLSPQHQKVLDEKMKVAGHAGRLRGAAVAKQKKAARVQAAKKVAKKTFAHPSSRDRFMLGMGLYWGEGIKTEQSTLAFINADPAAVVFMKRWFEEFFNFTKSDFNPYIFIASTHKDRELKIKKYWAKQLSLPISQFNRVVYIKHKHKKVYENHNCYFGTISLRLRRSTDVKYQILELVALSRRS